MRIICGNDKVRHGAIYDLMAILSKTNNEGHKRMNLSKNEVASIKIE